jgi:deoxyribodipyrimidine photolyase-related protein
MPPKRTLRLILGDQLNPRHSWFSRTSDDTVYTLMEVRQETDYVNHHIQKVVGFFAAMRRFAAHLEAAGHRVVYIRLDDPDNQQAFDANLMRIVQEERISHLEYQQPDEFRLDRQLADLGARLSIPATMVASEHFLTSRTEVQELFSGKKRFLMESFYRTMRKKHGILMEDGRPRGGRWNYDQSNRRRYDGDVPLPPPMVFENNVSDLAAMVDRQGVATIGRIAPEAFVWPLDRRQALAMLAEFVQARLPHFGRYQDAMTADSWSLFHSRLSFALNTKMLHPMEVIQAAVAGADANPRQPVGIEQLEGFVRQILGWREYLRGIYWARMPDYGQLNFFGHTAPLPDCYWSAATKMNCIRRTVEQSLEHAYAHHIQRLMVTGNFALLAGIAPDDVDNWYLGIYIDAVQWVEMVNTRGMSQFADGGLVATKPYASSANYIRKMSDYCGGCWYRHGKKTGSRACPFNSLYWDFLVRHREKLSGNHRIAMMFRTWDRMAEENRDALLKQARRYKRNLNGL